jgi:4-hydroxybenzoate polyprenyltransferase
MKIFIQLIRPINILIALVGCVLFRWISVGSLGDAKPLTAYLLGVVFIMIAGYLINDYFDFKTDQINKPHKPRFSNRNTYTILFLVFNALALLLSFYCATFKGYSSVPFVFSLGIALLWMYSYLFQVLPLIGNLTIAFLAILLYIPLKEGFVNTELTNLFMGLSFIVTLAREIIKDLEDKKGDQLSGYKTLPIVVGNQFSRILASFLIFLAMNILRSSFWDKLSSDYGLLTLFFAIEISLLLSILYMFFGFNQQLSNKGYQRASLQLKWSMAGFMLLIFLLI